jgi:hypothetical protein
MKLFKGQISEWNPEEDKRRRLRFFPSQMQASVTTPQALARACYPFPFPLSGSLTSFGVKRGLLSDSHWS